MGRIEARSRVLGSVALPDLTFETLEPRVLLSADALAGLLLPNPSTHLSEAAAHAALLADELKVSLTTNAAASASVGASAADVGSFQVALGATVAVSGSYEMPVAPAVAAPGRKAVAYVDATLPDFQLLVAAMRAAGPSSGVQLDVVTLPTGTDGLKAIDTDLAGRSDLSAVYVFSHGSEGRLTLDNTVIDVKALDARASEFQAWRHALAPGAELLFYGCNVAEGVDGLAFIDKVAHLTGANVAASTDPTGAASLGGDWSLEASTGPIAAPAPAPLSALASYPNLLSSVTWTGAGDGTSWGDAANWSGDQLPGATDAVIIDTSAGTGAITLGSGVSANVQSVTSARALTLANGATLQTATLQLSQNLTLSGGALRAATVGFTGGAQIVATGYGGTLDGVTLTGDATSPTALDIEGYPSNVQVTHGLTLNQVNIAIKNSGRIDFIDAAATLSGTGRVTFGDTSGYNALRETAAGGTLTIGSGITVAGVGGQVGYSTYWGGPSNVTVVNQGIIGSDQGGTFSLDGANVINQNILQVGAGGTLNLQGAGWTNSGVINAPAGTLNLGGALTIAQLGVINSAGATVNLTGTLDNTGTTLTVNKTTGSWRLYGGTIKGGTLTSADGAQFVATGNGGTLDGVTLTGDATLPSPLDIEGYPSNVQVTHGLTLNQVNIAIKNSGRIDFIDAAATLSGTGRVTFGDTSGYNALRETAAGGTLTIGSGITVAGVGGQVGYSTYWGGPTNVTVVNQGIIGSDQGGTFSLDGANVINQNILQVGAGGTLNLQGAGWTNSGVINAPAGTLNLGGALTIAQLGVINSAGATVNLTGTLDNTGTTLTVNKTTGSWRLYGGTIKGGTLTSADGAQFVATGNGGTLDGVTLTGDATLPSPLDIEGYPSNVQVTHGLTLNQVNIAIKNSGRIDFIDAAATLSGTGRVTFGDTSGYNALRETAAGGTLTIGSGITVAGVTGQVGYSNYWGGPNNVTLVNQGIIGSDQGGTFSLDGANVINQNILQVGAGGTLNLQGASWTNSGVINAPAGTLNLGGALTIAQLGVINSAGATVNLTGTLDNTGTTLTVNKTTGSWRLYGGTIKGGTLTSADGAQFVATGNGGTLDGVTLTGDATLPSPLDIEGYPSNVQVTHGLTLNQVNIAIKNSGRIDFIDAAATLSGTGRVTFGDTSGYNALRETAAGGTLTIGSGITVAGVTGQVGYSNYWGGPTNVTLVNQGVIGPDQEEERSTSTPPRRRTREPCRRWGGRSTPAAPRSPT